MKRVTRNKLEIKRRIAQQNRINKLSMGTFALTRAAIVPKKPVEVTLTREEKVSYARSFARAMLAGAFE